MVENKIIDLNYLSILKVSGQGAFELLQGQITCDLNKVNSTSSCLGALCNVKGRVISSFIVTSIDKEEFILIGPSEMLIRTEEELKKYSPFYKVEVNENQFLDDWGTTGNDWSAYGYS